MTERVEDPGLGPALDASCTASEVGDAVTRIALKRGQEEAAQPKVRARVRGDLIGRYVLLSELGEGGMGVVWAAYDPELDRRLALKVLRLAGDSDRLLREAQALARLAHPNVVSIHDVGEDAGEVWLAMELIEGRTLKEWQRAAPRRPWTEVLQILMPAGYGVAAAHDAGLIHRDLKPENLMVGDDGRVRVMDFGLARTGEFKAPATAPADPLASSEVSLLGSSVTRAGAILGTPLYMSPEQFSGAVDERSDLFSFSVVLWEILYGSRPFVGANVVEMVYAITQGRAQEAPRGRHVPRWLRKVLLRGLAGEPEQRWQSMRELLAALEKGLARERWRRLLGIVSALVFVGLSAVVWGVLADARQRSACTHAAASIGELWPAQAETVTAAIKASGVGNAEEIDEKLGERVGAWADEWAEVRETLCVAATVERTLSPALAQRAVDCSELQRSELHSLLELLGEGDRSVVLVALRAAGELSMPSLCGDPRVLGRLVVPEPDLYDEVTQLRSRLQRAQMMLALGKYKEGLAFAEELYGEAERLDWAPLRALAEVRVGQALYQNARYPEAEARVRDGLRQALAVSDDTLAVDAIIWLGFVAYELAEPDRGLAWIEVAEGILERMGPTARLLRPRVVGIAAILYQKRGDLSKAEEAYIEAQRLDEELYGVDSPQGASNLNSLALFRAAQGDVEEALKIHERVQALRIAAYGANHPEVAKSIGNRALAYRKKGDHERARELFEEALVLQEKVFGVDDPRTGATLNSLLGALIELKEFEEAAVVGARVLAIRRATFGTEHLEYAAALNNVAIGLQDQGRYEKAREMHQQALEIRQRKFGDEGNDVARSHTNLGEVDLRMGDREAAIAHLERAVEIREGIEAPPQSLAYSRFALAKAIGALDPGRARKLARQAYEVYAELEHPHAGRISTWLEAQERADPIAKKEQQKNRRR